jgi:hypothetical protein
MNNDEKEGHLKVAKFRLCFFFPSCFANTMQIVDCLLATVGSREEPWTMFWIWRVFVLDLTCSCWGSGGGTCMIIGRRATIGSEGQGGTRCGWGEREYMG